MNQRLVAALAEVFGLKEAEIRPSLTQDDVGSWDSLRQMDLVLSLEREFGVTLEMADIVRMVSVAGIEEVLRAKGVDLGA
ncbi:MAG TPA: acyl carrier protein [Dehalococcoidia bacterium]|jgi:acyl carrier protein|nr:acyl carrier protein [Dehalococcoidia bacterium]